MWLIITLFIVYATIMLPYIFIWHSSEYIRCLEKDMREFIKEDLGE